MRVAQVMAGAPAGGAELFFERLCMGLHRAGDVVLPAIRREPGRVARLRQAGLSPVEFGFGGALDVLTRRRLEKSLRAFAPSVVVAWMNRAAAMTPAGAWTLVGRLGGYYDLGYYRRCDHLVGNTRALVDWIRGQGWPAGRVHYLPNFVTDQAGAVAADRTALGVPAGVPLVLALGRLHRNKAFDVLIRAVARIADVHLVIGGEGPERGALLALAHEEGVADRVHLPGWIAEAGPLLAACDLLVCPSRIEPLGNVVIEAWSARRPVIASAIQGPAELIADGRDGVLVPAEDVAGLSRAISKVLRDSTGALVAAGLARFEAEFAEAPVVAQWRAFLTAPELARAAG